MITFGLYACTNNKFLNRKYTNGFFRELHKEIKNNPIKAKDETVEMSAYTSSELIKAAPLTNSQNEKEIIQKESNSTTPIIQKLRVKHTLTKEIEKAYSIQPNLLLMDVNTKNTNKPIQVKKYLKNELTRRTLVGPSCFTSSIGMFLLIRETKKTNNRCLEKSVTINEAPFESLETIKYYLSIASKIILFLCWALLFILFIALSFSTTGFFYIALAL